MYQDDNPALAVARDKHEKATVLPLLQLMRTDRLLDVGCGVGRWAVACAPVVKDYLGTDFSEALLRQAREETATFSNAEFMCLAAQDTELLRESRGCFSRVILAGILAYLNDEDVVRCLRGVADVTATTDAIVYLREPMGMSSRLTLDNFWSEQLGAEYSAIYRSRGEYRDFLESTLCAEGFQVTHFDSLYPENLENRPETSQFIVLLHRNAKGSA